MWREDKERKGGMIRPKHRRKKKEDVTKFHGEGLSVEETQDVMRTIISKP